MRSFTLSIQVENPESQLAGDKAQFYLEGMRTRARFQSAHALLKAAGIALVSFGPTVLLDHDFDGHRVSRASMDAFMATSVDEKDTAGEPLGFIATIGVTSELEDAEGLLPTPPNLDEEG